MSSYIFKENSEDTHWNKQWESYKSMAGLESLNEDVKTEIWLAAVSPEKYFIFNMRSAISGCINYKECKDSAFGTAYV